MTIQFALIIHTIVVALAVTTFAFVLWRRGLFTIMHAGSWLLLAVSIYFIYNPLAALVSDDLVVYRDALLILTREGPSRVFWILGVILAGLASWLFFYLRKRGRASERALSVAPVAVGRWTLPQLVVLGLLLAAALYSLLYLRTAGLLVDSDVEVEFDRGRIVGGATGYSVVAHGFFLFIVVLLLYRGPKWARRLGGVLAIGFVALRLYDTHDRSSIVSLLAAVAMVGLLRARTGTLDGRALVARLRRNKFKSAIVLAAAAAMAFFLVVRGHSSVADVKEYDIEKGTRTLRRNDTAMLPVLYVRSHLWEKNGYDYALPLVNSALFGWIPRRFAPWKDDLPKMILDQNRRRVTASVDFWLYGAKDTVMGSFYKHGGLIGVLLGMSLLGFVTRRLDRLVAAGRTDLGRAVGVVWLANAWMMFASSDNWIMQNVFINAIPFLGLWVVSKLERRRPARSLAPAPRR